MSFCDELISFDIISLSLLKASFAGYRIFGCKLCSPHSLLTSFLSDEKLAVNLTECHGLNYNPLKIHIKGFTQSISGEGEVAQSCLTLCDPMDCSLPGFSVHGILQARILEWVTISFSRGSSQPRD